MNRIPTSVVVAAALSVATLTAMSARAQAAGASVEEQIKKIEEDRAAALVKGDAAAVASQTSDDYTFINAYGQVTGKTQTINRASAPEDPLLRPRASGPSQPGAVVCSKEGLVDRTGHGLPSACSCFPS